MALEAVYMTAFLPQGESLGFGSREKPRTPLNYLSTLGGRFLYYYVVEKTGVNKLYILYSRESKNEA